MTDNAEHLIGESKHHPHKLADYDDYDDDVAFQVQLHFHEEEALFECGCIAGEYICEYALHCWENRAYGPFVQHVEMGVRFTSE